MRILVVTSVFPNGKQPNLGIFVKERMFKVAKHCELKVVAPVPWFPLIRWVKKDYRPSVPFREIQDGIEVLHPRFFNFPKYLKFLDGFFFFLSALITVRSLRKEFDFSLIDAHFVYPDGLGAVLLGHCLGLPVTLTVRGTIRKFMDKPLIRPQIRFALNRAARVFTVCQNLKVAAEQAGGDPETIEVVANGVDIEKFQPIEQSLARKGLGIGQGRKVVISVGGLVERKGFHRVIEILPTLRREYPDILYVIVGGSSVEGNCEPRLRRLVAELGLEDNVLFVGPQPHDQLYRWLSAADVFCLATTNEGWANVFLEAMACGLPVVTTRVGGNSEVISSPEFGTLIDLDNPKQLERALALALEKKWDRAKIIEYARSNTWTRRVDTLLNRFNALVTTGSTSTKAALPREG